MAFDIYHYFAEQTEIQKPQLLKEYPNEQRQALIYENNALVLGKLISEWRSHSTILYQQIQYTDPLYIQEIVRHLVTHKANQSILGKNDLEQLLSEIATLQLTELKQLDQTGHYGEQGIGQLLTGQLDYLHGQAEDWVWSSNQLTELLGSKAQLEHSELDETTEDSEMSHDNHNQHIEVTTPTPPTWAKILEPVVALAILAYLYCAYTHLTALS
ncbi:MAG: hypothetical protein QM666_06140 [Acinetobacter sp.]